MGIVFDWTFNIGNVLTLLGGIIFAAGFLYSRGGQEVGTQLSLKELTRELTEMKSEFRDFSETLKKVAIQEMQIGLLMKWYDELRRGEGYVTGHRGKMDGEYNP